MIKLILEINENKGEMIQDEDIIATCVDVNVIEVRKKPTKAEIKTVNMLKEKINIKDKVQTMNECRIEKNKKMVDLIDKLLSF